MSCAKSARCSVQILTIREVTEYVFDTPEETLKSQRQRRQNAYMSHLWLFAISAVHSFIQSGLKWALYAFFFLAFPAHGDPLRLDAIAVLCPLIGIITKKYEMMARKRMEKSRCSNDGDFCLRGRRFWRDENDGDSVLMTESWQVCVTAAQREVNEARI